MGNKWLSTGICCLRTEWFIPWMEAMFVQVVHPCGI